MSAESTVNELTWGATLLAGMMTFDGTLKAVMAIVAVGHLVIAVDKWYWERKRRKPK